MVFPGVLRGRPGPRLATTHTSRPRRSLSSPGMYCPSIVAAPASPSGEAQQQKQKRRGPGPLEEPAPADPKAFRFGWRGLTPRWPRSLRLGSASGFKVARSRAIATPPRQTPRTFRKKVRAARRLRRSSLIGAATMEPWTVAISPCPTGPRSRPAATCRAPRPTRLHARPAAAHPAPRRPAAGAAGGTPSASNAAGPCAGACTKLRKRIGSAFAGLVALIAKFGVGAEGAARGAAEPEAACDRGHRAGVGRRVQHLLRLVVRGGLRACCCSCTRWAT